MTRCPFCVLIAGDAIRPTTWRETQSCVLFEPLHPVTAGHTLVVPKVHVTDATKDAAVTAAAMIVAARHARTLDACNIITSVGAAATQTVFHLHLHVIPRREGDGLLLPWSRK
jgi:histidine triad (HIT) family protein